MSEQWPLRKLSEVIEIQNGFAFSRREYTEEGHFLIRIGNVQNGALNLNKPNYVVLNTKSLKFELSEGDLLISLTGNIGRVARVEKSHLPAALNQRVARMKLSDSGLINSDFLYYFLRSDGFRNTLTASGHGTAQKNVSTKAIGEIEIPVPPMEEQQRIVKIIDDSFVKINQNITKLQSKFDLITDIYSSQIKSIFSNADERWVKSTLGELSNVKSGGTPLRSREDYWGGNIPWFSSGELNNIFTTKPNRYITNLGLEKSNAKIFPKDSLLIGMYDTAALKMSIMDREGTFNQAIAGVKPNPDLDMRFLLHAINNVKKEVRAQRRGTRQKNLNLTKIKNIELLIPPIKIQVKIADKLDSLIDSVQKIESIFSEQLECRKELKQSLLQEAFNGNLTMEITA